MPDIHVERMLKEMTDGTPFYKNGSVRFVGTYSPREDGTEEYIAGALYREDGKLWMEGEFQTGGLRRGQEYYPSGQLMFSGEYIDIKIKHCYGPPYPLIGKYYDESGYIIYDGNIPIGHSGNLAYPHIRLPDGSKGSIHGIPANHADRDLLWKEHYKKTADFGQLPSYEDFRNKVREYLVDYFTDGTPEDFDEFFRSEETEEMIRMDYNHARSRWNNREITEMIIMNGVAASVARCLWLIHY